MLLIDIIQPNDQDLLALWPKRLLFTERYQKTCYCENQLLDYKNPLCLLCGLALLIIGQNVAWTGGYNLFPDLQIVIFLFEPRRGPVQLPASIVSWPGARKSCQLIFPFVPKHRLPERIQLSTNLEVFPIVYILWFRAYWCCLEIKPKEGVRLHEYFLCVAHFGVSTPTTRQQNPHYSHFSEKKNYEWKLWVLYVFLFSKRHIQQWHKAELLDLMEVT